MALTPGFDLRKNPKNFIINGDMRIAQRNTTFTAVANGTYSLDRYIYYKVGAMVHTITQDTDVPTLAQSGYLFINSLRMNLTTPDTAIAATDLAAITQRIEGYNWANLAQKPFTLSFWVKATLPGIYCVGFQNSANDRSYVAEYTINATNTWEYKTITVAASPAAGTWNYTNGNGMEVNWTIAAGANFQQTANSWQANASAKSATVNQVNGVNTGATDFRITGIMLNEGFDALPFRLFGEDILSEILACQRYYEKSYNLTTIVGAAGTGSGYYAASTATSTGTTWWEVSFAAKKRATPPSVIVYNPLTGAAGSADRSGVAISAAVASVTEAHASFVNTVVTTANAGHTIHYAADAEL